MKHRTSLLLFKPNGKVRIRDSLHPNEHIFRSDSAKKERPKTSLYLSIEKLVNDFNAKVQYQITHPKLFEAKKENKINTYVPLIYQKGKKDYGQRKQNKKIHIETEQPYKVYLTMMREKKKVKNVFVAKTESKIEQSNFKCFDFSKQLPRKPLFVNAPVKRKRFVNTFANFDLDAQTKQNLNQLQLTRRNHDENIDDKRMELINGKTKSHICAKIKLDDDLKYTNLLYRDSKLREEIRTNFKVY